MSSPHINARSSSSLSDQLTGLTPGRLKKMSRSPELQKRADALASEILSKELQRRESLGLPFNRKKNSIDAVEKIVLTILYTGSPGERKLLKQENCLYNSSLLCSIENQLLARGLSKLFDLPKNSSEKKMLQQGISQLFSLPTNNLKDLFIKALKLGESYIAIEIASLPTFQEWLSTEPPALLLSLFTEAMQLNQTYVAAEILSLPLFRNCFALMPISLYGESFKLAIKLGLFEVVEAMTETVYTDKLSLEQLMAGIMMAALSGNEAILSTLLHDNEKVKTIPKEYLHKLAAATQPKYHLIANNLLQAALRSRK